ncbi:MAG TPA: peptide ABC transporter substrate-binding protein, partial [Myxococcota bacterium]|nr:peptide ABC transporter substrate-binding protein [Myxococcota bacterium]
MRRGHSTFIAFAATLAACQSVPQIYYGTPRPRHPPDELWINNSGEPEYIDPGKSSDSLGSEVIANLFAGLAEVHPQSLTPVPEIATHWDISADGRVYTFHLRESAWSDGQPLTAEDFAFSWRRVLDPNTASRYGSMLHVLKNGQPFNQRALFVAGEHDPDTVARAFTPHIPVARAVRSEAPPGVFVYLGGKDADKSKHLRAALGLTRLSVAGQPLTPRLAGPELVGVRALDARTLQVELEHPLPYFLSLVAYTTFKPVPRHVLDRLAAAHQEVDLWTRPEHIVSNGPYVLTSWHFKHYFTYERNPRYWDAQAVRIRKVKVYEVESANTALNLYRDGDLDWLGSNTPLPSEFLAHLEGFKDCHRDPMLSVYFYWLNTRQAPLDNVKVRRALSLAVDREALVKYVTRGGQLPSADLVPDGLAGYAGLKRPVFDPNAARTLLAEAGFPGGQGLKPITLIYNTSEGHKQIAEAVQGMWHKHL